MGTLTMALAAVMLAGSAPEKVSGEMRQVLDLNGEWEGTYSIGSFPFDARLIHGVLWVDGRRGLGRIPARFFDDGDGILHMETGNHRYASGTYRQTTDRLAMTFLPAWDRGSHVLILRRVKPRK